MPSHEFFRRYLQALNDIHGFFSLEKTQTAVVQSAVVLFGARGASLLMFDPGGEHLIVSASFGLSETYKSKGAVNPQQSLGETLLRVPVVVRDVAVDPNVQYREAALQEGIRCIVGLPLAAGNLLAGSLRLYFAQTMEFKPEEMESLTALAAQASHALKKAFYFASMKTAVFDIERLHETDVKRAMQSLVKTMAAYGLAHACRLMLVDRATETMSNMVSFGLSDTYVAKGPVGWKTSLGEVTSGMPVVISDVAADPRVQYREAALAENIRTILGLPVRIGTQVVGALRLYYRFVFEPDADYVEWMQHLTHHVGMALEKARMMAQVQDRATWYEAILKDFER
ncbi:MAG: GAF domain-containing protein [Desulfobacterales bacterium]|jgi:GAF domain-containing protein|nr:GAF domain-containing protein [Desulfobacterales bacterium]